MTDIAEAARRSWRIRRRIKRLLFSWVVIWVVCVEAGASWFGILIAEHAPMPLADAKLIAERTATAVFFGIARRHDDFRSPAVQSSGKVAPD